MKLPQFKDEIKIYERVNFQDIAYKSQISRTERPKIIAFNILISFGAS